MFYIVCLGWSREIKLSKNEWQETIQEQKTEFLKRFPVPGGISCAWKEPKVANQPTFDTR